MSSSSWHQAKLIKLSEIHGKMMYMESNLDDLKVKLADCNEFGMCTNVYCIQKAIEQETICLASQDSTSIMQWVDNLKEAGYYDLTPMPPSKGPIWDHFLTGEKQNGSHVCAHCRSCIEKQCPDGEITELDDDGKPKLMSESWVVEACKADVGGILGVKESMIAHMLGKGGNISCPNVSSEAHKTAITLKKGKGKRVQEDSGSDSDSDDDKSKREQKPKKKLLTKLLNSANADVMKQLKVELKGAYAIIASDGWKDELRNSVNGVNLSVAGKDGASMCKAFENIIDKAEDVQQGRKDIVLKRPWLFGPPCCAHQFQLILKEYFSENEEAAETAEEATDLIGWILNHGQDIIAVQVGAEKNLQRKKKLKDNAVTHCELIDDGGFWRRLKFVVDGLEPICLGLNMNQTDAMHPNQALLTFAGIFLYFQKHSKCSVANGMTKRIEKRWKALDQPMFMLVLVLNPFEGISCFGDKAAVSLFTLYTILLDTYCRVCSKPPKVPRSENEQQAHEVMQVKKEKEVSEAFLNYLSSKGAFEDWIKNKEIFQCVHGDDPLTMWKAFLHTPSILELADFAILLLGISVNQAGLERSFSDLKIKKTHLRNHLTLPRLKKMAKYADVLEEYGDQSKDENIVYGHQHLKWLPQSLELLFGGWKDTDIDEQVRWICRQKAHTEEVRLMELLADEEADEERIPDDRVLATISTGESG
ncbi:hypothetical protein L208DRAFT_1377167 [Tricholoma matsutake]|nr:hypothetical protein L208DRAFT_1377167 [Tricholoma matsutake 945]